MLSVVEGGVLVVLDEDVDELLEKELKGLEKVEGKFEKVVEKLYLGGGEDEMVVVGVLLL